jgi:hypothetical protein
MTIFREQNHVLPLIKISIPRAKPRFTPDKKIDYEGKTHFTPDKKSDYESKTTFYP